MTEAIKCECAGPGFCPVFKREQDRRDYELCSGNVTMGPPVDDAMRAAYQKLWRRTTQGPNKEPPYEPPRNNGPMLWPRPYRRRPCDFFNPRIVKNKRGCNCPTRWEYACEIYDSATYARCQWCPSYSDTGSGLDEPILGSKTWAVGIYTTFRVKRTLPHSMASLFAAGWPTCTLFIDRDGEGRTVDVPSECEHVEIVQRNETLGAWKNFFTGLKHLYDTQIADLYMMNQCDVVYAPGLRRYIERTWPQDAGVVSPYCSGRYKQAPHGYLRWKSRGFWGACSFIFTRKATEQFLSWPTAVEWDKDRNIDTVVGSFGRHAEHRLYICRPSLAQHVGEFKSTLNHGGGGGLSAHDFVGEVKDIGDAVWST